MSKDTGTIAFCPGCGCEHPEASALLNQHLKDMATNTALKNELAKQRGSRPAAREAKALFEHWADRLGKKASVVYGPDRQKACLAMLDLFPAATLKLAIDGLAKYPYDAGYGNRSPVPVDGLPRRDDLKFVFASEVRVEQFVKLAAEDEDRVDPIPLKPAGPVKLAVERLQARFGDDVFEWWDGWWWSPCPLHPYAGAAPFRLREDPKAPGLLKVQCANGCNRHSLLTAVGVEGDEDLLLWLAA